jgi:hypothetical protein
MKSELSLTAFCSEIYLSYFIRQGRYRSICLCVILFNLLKPSGLKFINAAFCRQSALMCFVCVWEQTAKLALYSINCVVIITETESVYCAVRTGSLKNRLRFVLKGLIGLRCKKLMSMKSGVTVALPDAARLSASEFPALTLSAYRACKLSQ